MDIVELVVAVCLQAQPAVCEERRFQFVEDAALFGCMLRAQPYLAQWAETHPGWAVKQWTCAFPRRDKDA